MATTLLARSTATPYFELMQVVIETPGYLIDAKDVSLTEDERRIIVDFVAGNPDAGIEMKGTGGTRILRFAGRGKGKSGEQALAYTRGEATEGFVAHLPDEVDVRAWA